MRLSTGLVLAAMVASGAHASIISGTFGFVPTFGGASFTGGSLGSAASVTVTAAETINTLPALYLARPNDFIAAGLALGDIATIAAADVSLGVTNLNAGRFPLVLPGYLAFSPASRFGFDVTGISWTSSAATNLSFVATGNLIDHLGVFSLTAADISGSFTTTGAGSVNASFTLTTEDATPEVGSVLMLLSALLVFGWLRGARKAG